MSGLLSKLSSKKNQHFMKRNEHLWFHEYSSVQEAFSNLYSVVKPYSKVYSLLSKLIFVQSNGQYACTVNANINIIIVFPELVFLMKNNRRDQAVAILLHEIGHIILEHQKNSIPNEQAQIEADLFAAELGYGNYLYDFLLTQGRSTQIQNRLVALGRVKKK